MRKVWVVPLAALVGCTSASKYAVVRPGLECDRAVRVAYRTFVEMGYTVTDVTRPGTGPGAITGTKKLPSGETTTGRVVITCTAQGAELQPVEDAMVPNWEFSRMFGYSYKSLVQRPDVEEPAKQVGLQVLVHAIPTQEARLDLGGDPTVAGAVPVRVTIRNNTDRAIAIDPARLELVRDDGETARPLTGKARDAALAPGAAGDRMRAEALTAAKVSGHTTVSRFLVFPPGRYREARLSIEDVETQESDGFVAPVE